jgi:hypothetical protein
VTFFVRTQQHNTWQTPLYGFNNCQKKAFYRLIEAAKQEVARKQSDSSSSSDDKDEGDSSEEEIETMDKARTKDANKYSTAPRGIKMVQLVALDFCIELLNQAI